MSQNTRVGLVQQWLHDKKVILVLADCSKVTQDHQQNSNVILR